jgi:hypothetical protein
VGVAGVIEMDWSAPCVTVNVAVPEIDPEVAVIVVVPG